MLQALAPSHICGPMRRGECLEHGGNVKCQWGYVTSNHWANYGPYGSPVSHCCNCKGFQMPENFADSYWTTAPASWVWNGNWKNTYSSTGTELPSTNPTGEPTEEAYVKVPGDSSCAAEGYEDYTDAMGGTAQGCRKAAESVGYDFSSPASQLHAIPVQHHANGEHRSCVACENMIYQGRPTLLFFDSQSRSVNPNQCDQSGEQIKFHICKIPVNCVMNQWENSGGCSATCGGGSQLQTRTVQTPAANGGTACPSTSQTIRCNTDACPLETASTFNDPVVSNGFYCGNGAGQLVPGYRFLRTVNMDA